MIKKCKVCKKEIYVKPCLGDRKKYCSKECMYIGRPKKELKVIECVCENCGKKFDGIPSEVARGRSRFCKRQCYFDWRKKQRTIKCEYCGKDFDRHNVMRRFCSYGCYIKDYRGNGYKKNVGKKYDLKRGYVGIRNNKNKIVFEHRHIWEEHHGKIKKGNIIHHLNGIKDDNRITNLISIPRNEHLNMHHFKTAIKIYEERIKQLETKLSKCNKSKEV